MGQNFIVETAASNNETGMVLDAITTDVTPGSEDFSLSVKLMAAGATAAEVFNVGSTGVATFSGNVVSDTDSTDDLGTTGVRWANAYIDDLDITTNIVVGGTVDGRDVASDGTKLDAIEASADVTDATNVAAAGAVMESDTSTASMSFVIDEDAMGSDSATKVPTQQSTKAYVDAMAISANSLSGALLSGNSTSGTDIVVTAADKITTDTIAETTAASGVTIDSVLLKDNTVTATTFIGAVTGTASGNLVSGGALGTPASGVATNLTGTAASLTAGSVTTNANLTGHITSTGNAAVLGSFTSAQLAAALTNETGSGAAVFATSPSLVTPALGTPASGVMTNATGLPPAGVVGTAAILGANTFTGAQTFSSTLNKFTLTAPTTAATINTRADNLTHSLPAITGNLTLEQLQQNIQSAAYTTVLADAGKQILHPSADTTARTFTIDSNANVAYPVGTAITFVNQVSAGVVTIAITTDTMRLAGAGTTGSRTLAANGIATALKITATEWIISGTGLT